MKLEISLFKFDKNSDYLPYYTKHFLKTENEKNILDILNTINKTAKLGFENSTDFDLVINGVFVKASITLEEVIENFGKELTIEPISIRRAYDDLLIDENDFKEKIKILKDLAQEEDKLEYLKLKQYWGLLYKLLLIILVGFQVNLDSFCFVLLQIEIRVLPKP